MVNFEAEILWILLTSQLVAWPGTIISGLKLKFTKKLIKYLFIHWQKNINVLIITWYYQHWNSLNKPWLFLFFVKHLCGHKLQVDHIVFLWVSSHMLINVNCLAKAISVQRLAVKKQFFFMYCFNGISKKSLRFKKLTTEKPQYYADHDQTAWMYLLIMVCT